MTRKKQKENVGSLLITGNVQVDRNYLELPGNIVIDGPQSSEALQALKDLAKASQLDGTVCFVQLSHAGPQAETVLDGGDPIGPSATSLKKAGQASENINPGP